MRYDAFERFRALERIAVTFLIVGALLLIAFVNTAHAKPPKRIVKARHKVEKRARGQLGTPYVYGGSSPSGFDCSGFTRWVLSRHANLPHSAAQQFSLGGNGDFKRVWRRGLRTGDLVFFDTTGAYVGHAGIYIGKGHFIHSSSSSGVRIDALRDSYYNTRWVGATRIPALRAKR